MTRIAVAGAGLVGNRHARILAEQGTLCAIADPAPVGAALADTLQVPHYPDLESLIRAEKPDGVMVATPNQRHEPDGLACIRAGIPVLIEKPLAGDVAAGERLVAAADGAGVPLLVGHHRRYNPLIADAKSRISAGELGSIVALHASCWFYKPDPYFDVGWRREPGAGPVLINMIHDIDLMQHLCGDIISVQAQEANATRGFAVEDTASALLRFASGALGTISVSDTIVSPWSWELTAAENPAYPVVDGFAYLIGGTHGALSIPDMTRWQNVDERSWLEPLNSENLKAGQTTQDPLIAQASHFAEVILGRAKPLVPGIDGLKALRVIDAIKEAAATGLVIELPRGETN